MFVDELRVTVASQQYTEIVKPGDHALQLYPIHEEDREWGFALADMIEEGILQIL